MGGRGALSRGGAKAGGVSRKGIKRQPTKAAAAEEAVATELDSQTSLTSKESPEAVQQLHINTDGASVFFSGNASFDQHYAAQNANRCRYVATAIAFDEYGIEMVPNARARSLAAAMARHDRELIEFYLGKTDCFADVLKAVTLLDSGREARAIAKRIAQIISSTKTAVSPKTSLRLAALRNQLRNLESTRPSVGSCSGALAKYLRAWTRRFTVKQLETFALTMPKEPWRKLANLMHLNASRDFPDAPWFLPFCFSTFVPEPGSKLHKLGRKDTFVRRFANDLIAEFDDVPFSLIKKQGALNQLNDTSKRKLAASETSLSQVIWNYEYLACAGVDEDVCARLQAGEKITLGYGKLMERLLMFKDRITAKNKYDRISNKRPKGRAAIAAAATAKASVAGNSYGTSLLPLVMPIAQDELAKFKASLASPVAVLGDASASMSVAIRTATIISSLLAAICAAKLSFFNGENVDAKLANPRSIPEVLDVAFATKADGCTSPAASLVPYYDRRELVRTFIIVTDEEENTEAQTADGRSWLFYELFEQYRRDVYPAALIFVSFLRSQHGESPMYGRFVCEKTSDVMQFKFNRERPDLTKLDSILGTICSRSSQSFNSRVEQLESDIRQKGLIDAFKSALLSSSSCSTTTRIN